MKAAVIHETFDIDELLKQLPTGERWIRHLKEDLIPFWEMPEALGVPVGNFPTYRNNDGTNVDQNNPGLDFEGIVPGLVELDREYIRAKSRQCYAYGIAFHLTGEVRYLDYAKAGCNYIIESAFDFLNGSVCSYLKNGEQLPPFRQRTSQDLAYALTGIGFLYYLTRDTTLLKYLVDVHEFIWTNYYDPEAGLISWVAENSSDGDNVNQKELVANLDQVYGYMLAVTPSLPEPHQKIWKSRLCKLANIMMDQFYSPRVGMFWGAITDSTIKKFGTPHTDFGHSIKTFWLISLIGSLTDNYEMFISAENRASSILQWAFVENNGSWGRCIKPDGTLDEDKEWWICCELDQVAGALSLADPAYMRYIVKTYKYWFDYMVDHKDHEVWHMVDGKTNEPVRSYPKQHSWKNALHTFEHALVSYMFAQELRKQPTSLYFAWKEIPNHPDIHPYFYQGKVANINTKDAVHCVSFIDIH